MDRQDVAVRLAARLYAAESAIDAALSETAALVAFLPMARAEAYLSAVAGQRVFEGAAGSVMALTEARAKLVETHRALAGLARSLNIDVSAVGPLDKPDDTPPAHRPKRARGLNKTLP